MKIKIDQISIGDQDGDQDWRSIRDQDQDRSSEIDLKIRINFKV